MDQSVQARKLYLVLINRIYTYQQVYFTVAHDQYQDPARELDKKKEQGYTDNRRILNPRNSSKESNK